jgi:hypothetical protein
MHIPPCKRVIGKGKRKLCTMKTMYDENDEQ